MRPEDNPADEVQPTKEEWEAWERERDLLLKTSAFGTLNDASRFIAWYETTEHHSAWDDTRYIQAKQILR